MVLRKNRVLPVFLNSVTNEAAFELVSPSVKTGIGTSIYFKFAKSLFPIKWTFLPLPIPTDPITSILLILITDQNRHSCNYKWNTFLIYLSFQFGSCLYPSLGPYSVIGQSLYRSFASVSITSLSSRCSVYFSGIPDNPT